MKARMIRAAGVFAMAILSAGLMSCAGFAAHTEGRHARVVAMGQMLAIRDATKNESRETALEVTDRFLTAMALEIQQRFLRNPRLVSDDELRMLFRWKTLLHRGEARIVPAASREYFVEPAPRLYIPVP